MIRHNGICRCILSGSALKTCSASIIKGTCDLYIHVAVRRYKFIFNNQTRRTIYPNLSCHKTLHVSGNFCAHHQESPTVHSALVIFMQVMMTASKHSEDGTLLGSGHHNLHESHQCRMYSRRRLMMGTEVVRNM